MDIKTDENENTTDIITYIITYILAFILACLMYILCLPAIWLLKFFSYINKQNKPK